MTVTPQIGWGDVDAADQTVILFQFKQKYIYACAMCEVEGWLTCDLKVGSIGCTVLALDRFRISAMEHDGIWEMDWLLNPCGVPVRAMAYPVPYLPGVRFCNPLAFDEGWGRYGEGATDACEDWWAICDAARQVRDESLCQSYWCQSFRWKSFPENERLFQALWDNSNERGYEVDARNCDGRGKLWLRMWRRAQDMKRQLEWDRKRDVFHAAQQARWRAQRLQRVRTKPLKVKPLEIMGAYAGITKN